MAVHNNMTRVAGLTDRFPAESWTLRLSQHSRKFIGYDRDITVIPDELAAYLHSQLVSLLP